MILRRPMNVVGTDRRRNLFLSAGNVCKRVRMDVFKGTEYVLDAENAIQNETPGLLRALEPLSIEHNLGNRVNDSGDIRRDSG